MATVDSSPIPLQSKLNLAAYAANTVVTYASLTGIFGATNTEVSNRYQTLLTPAGWAFSIWGPIFVWEGVFVAAQLSPGHRQSQAVTLVSPLWWALCLAQVAWTLAFAQELVTLALALMLCILACLLGISWRTDGLQLGVAEYFLLRAPFSLHLGWIIVASVVSINVRADAAKAAQETLLASAVTWTAVVLVVVFAFALAVPNPDPFVGLVAAWAFAGISSELGKPAKLNDPSRFNPSEWDSVTLAGLRDAARAVSMLALGLAAVAAILKAWKATKQPAQAQACSELELPCR